MVSYTNQGPSKRKLSPVQTVERHVRPYVYKTYFKLRSTVFFSEYEYIDETYFELNWKITLIDITHFPEIRLKMYIKTEAKLRTHWKTNTPVIYTFKQNYEGWGIKSWKDFFLLH